MSQSQENFWTEGRKDRKVEGQTLIHRTLLATACGPIMMKNDTCIEGIKKQIVLFFCNMCPKKKQIDILPFLFSFVVFFIGFSFFFIIIYFSDNYFFQRQLYIIHDKLYITSLINLNSRCGSISYIFHDKLNVLNSVK